MAIIRATQAGNFSNTATWVGGVVPTTGDIACCGNFRVTVDQNVLATLSPTNIDWVAGGGTALATNHTGGFDILQGSNFIIDSARYECFRTTLNPTTSADIYCLNASLSVLNDFTCIGISSNTAGSCVYFTTTNTTPVTITVNKIIVPNLTASSHYAIKAEGAANNSNVTVNINGNIETTNGAAIAVGRALNVIGYYINLEINVAGTVQHGTGMITVTPTAIPTGNSTVNFAVKTLILGAGSASNTLSISSVKAVNFSAGYCMNTALTGTVMNITSVNNILFSGNIEQLGSANATMQISSTQSITVNGNIIRNPSVSSPTATLLIINGSGALTINGTLQELADAQTSGSSSYSLVDIGGLAANFYCKGIIATGMADYVIDTTTGTWNYTLTIDGDVVATNVNYGLSAGTLVDISCSSITLVITGNIYPPTLGTTSTYSTGCIRVTNTVKVIRILGTCFGSTKQPTVSLGTTASQPTQEFFINKIEGAPYNSANTYQIATVYADRAVVTVNELVVGSSGRNPINGQFLFKDTTTAIIRARDSTGAEILLMEQLANTIPIASDIREGVVIGSTTGTLEVSTIEQVAGIDNSLVLQNILSAIRGNSFTDYSLDANWSQVSFHIDSSNDRVISDGLIHPSFNVNSSLVLSSGLANQFRGKPSVVSPTAPGYMLSDLNSGNYPIIDNTGDFTFELWLKSPNTLSQLQMLMSVLNGFNFEITPEGKLGFWHYNENSSVYYTSTEVIESNQWHHVAMTRSGSIYRLFKNGKIVVETNLQNPNFNKNLFTILTAGWDSSKRFVGIFQDLTITRMARYTTNFIPKTLAYPYTEFNETVDSINGNRIFEKLSTVKKDTSFIKANIL